MIETPNPEIDVDRLMAEIREDVRQARAGRAALPAESGEGGEESWYAILDDVQVAERHAAVGLEPPAFHRFGPVVRRVARLAARGVLALSQVVTIRQRTYNEASVSALRSLAERVRGLEEGQRDLRRQLAEARRELARLGGGAPGDAPGAGDERAGAPGGEGRAR